MEGDFHSTLVEVFLGAFYLFCSLLLDGRQEMKGERGLAGLHHWGVVLTWSASEDASNTYVLMTINIIILDVDFYTVCIHKDVEPSEICNPV